MRLIKIISVGITIAAINSAYASPSPKTVSIPFNNEVINSVDHNGLAFNYSLNTYPATKIVCKLTNAYKSWFEFSNQGIAVESGTFGGQENVIFSTTDQTSKNSEYTIHYQADQTGAINVFDAADSKSSHAVLSCNYAPDNII